ncbi:probable indole-3-pyruvate monooxygenase YUCCA10 [Cucurbita pepo subsp. pepo]|uniref:probable indole-3-pyruvate monooxygenase YUCCA10 n=1 Tax=Cucurbita pepo subsp. pepo TaxID=3664 RepID=UPI000C9DA48F|nr:probable indole-3-pyruvate monooxygenase YUCCA10 [Cucurbita pepo subsp. pepo]
MADIAVIIIGAGPSGLATAATLTLSSIPYIILERDDCSAPLWRKHSYDRLHLHLPKKFCQLPGMPFPSSAPKYVPKANFLDYLDSYTANFGIQPLYRRNVEAAEFDSAEKKWRVRARNLDDGEIEEFSGRFLVVATGETAEAYTPVVEGIGGFGGEVMHSTEFKSGKGYEGKNVLVVGSGNSGMEIALDLALHGAHTSLLIRSPIHVVSRGMVKCGLIMLKYFSVGCVDWLMIMASKLVYGNPTKYGIIKPAEGPMAMKIKYGKYPVIDRGTVHKIKSGQIQVLPTEISSINGNNILFKNGKYYPFDCIIFCTGFKRSTNLWLKGDEYLLNEDGLPKPSYPNHWKGKNGLYCVGLSRRGLHGLNFDAQNVAKGIASQIYKGG